MRNIEKCVKWLGASNGWEPLGACRLRGPRLIQVLGSMQLLKMQVEKPHRQRSSRDYQRGSASRSIQPSPSFSVLVLLRKLKRASHRLVEAQVSGYQNREQASFNFGSAGITRYLCRGQPHEQRSRHRADPAARASLARPAEPPSTIPLFFSSTFESRGPAQMYSPDMVLAAVFAKIYLFHR